MKRTAEEEALVSAETELVDSPWLGEAPDRVSDGPGALVGRYVVLGTLGQGGMGVVLSAYDPELDRKVAIKLVRPEATHAGSRDRMIREARAMAKLSHPSVVSVFDAGEHRGAVYIAMEFVGGRTLTAYLRDVTGWSAVLDVMLPAARGLAAAHEHGLVHRDFKPDNVMVADDGRILVMDFGLARAEGEGTEPDDLERSDAIKIARSASALGENTDGLTRDGAVMGTPAYMAPEQFEGASVGPRADQFAFCVTMWEALYGERPFAGKGIWELGRAVTEGIRRDPPAGRAVPGWLFDVMARGLLPDPIQRHDSMDALLTALTQGRRRARNRWVGASSAAAVLTVSGTLYADALADRRAIARCEAEALETLVWPARKDPLREGLQHSGLPFATSTFETVSTQLDAWTDEWTEMRAALCREEVLGGATDPALRRAQTSCLEGTNETTGLLLDTLSDDDPTLAVFAVDDVAITSNLEPCRDTTRLARLPMPDEAVHDTVAAAQSQLRRAAILHKTGQLDTAYGLTTAALAELESTGFEHAVVQAKVRLGALLVERGDLEEGRARLEDAFYAAGALDDDETAAEAARHLAGMGPRDEPYGIVWVRGWFSQAQMLHARLGLSESFEQAEICEALGAHLAALDDPQTLDEERRLLQRARDIRLAKVGPDHPAVVVAELNLAMYDAEGDPEGTLAKLRDGRARLEQAFGPRHPLMVMIQLMLAEVMSTAGDRRGALDEADRALALAAEVHGPAHPQTELVREIRAELAAQ